MRASYRPCFLETGRGENIITLARGVPLFAHAALQGLGASLAVIAGFLALVLCPCKLSPISLFMRNYAFSLHSIDWD